MRPIWTQTWLFTFVQFTLFYHVFVATNAENVSMVSPTTLSTITTTVSTDDRQMLPDFSICDSLPKRRQKACKMVLQMGASARKAEQKGEFTEDELPPPSVKLGISFGRKAAKTLAWEEPSELPPRVIAEHYACLNMTCLCKYYGGESSAPDQCLIEENSNAKRSRRQTRKGKRRYFGKALRTEYRMLSDQQRHQFHSALQQLKHGRGSYEYDRITFLHSNPRMMPSAHSGPTFLPWHREYLKRFEIALRAIDPSVAVPYWDSTMDQRLDNPADSILWTDLFLGSTNGDGYVVDGFLANWVTSNGDPVQRDLGTDGELLSEEEISRIIQTQRHENIFGFPSRRPTNPECTFPRTNANDLLEFNHNSVHTWIGGDMERLPNSPQDPIFFLHHAFVDLIWEQWRLNWQTREERETQFPPDSQIVACAGSRNFLLNATMLPFYDPAVLNRVGLSNDYTDFLYAYAPRPICQSDGGCGSPYLFCDTTTGTALCCAKIKPGGNCAKFEMNSEEPCHDSICISGRCQPNFSESRKFVHVHSFEKSLSNASSNFPIETTTTTKYDVSFSDESDPTSVAYQHTNTTTQPPQSPAPDERECFDNHECCVQWAANGSCRAAPRFMNTWCSASCRYDGCRPQAPAERLMEQGIQVDVHSQCLHWAHFHEHNAAGEGGNAFKPGLVLKRPTLRSECQRNRHWMARNCPEACGCAFVRELLDQCSKNMPEDYKLDPFDE